VWQWNTTVYALLARRWIAVITAAAVALSRSIFCTMLLEPTIWSALLGSGNLGGTDFALFRSISIYPWCETAGPSASLAFPS
jgi:hypothetical protein